MNELAGTQIDPDIADGVVISTTDVYQQGRPATGPTCWYNLSSIKHFHVEAIHLLQERQERLVQLTVNS